MICKTRAWGDALRLARQDIPDFAFDAWLAPLRVKLAEDRIVLGCPTSFHRDRVRLHYSEILLRCWRQARATQASDEAADGARATGDVSIELVLMKDFAAAPGFAIEMTRPSRGDGEEPAGVGAMAMPTARTPEAGSRDGAAPHGMRRVRTQVPPAPAAVAANGAATRRETMAPASGAMSRDVTRPEALAWATGLSAAHAGAPAGGFAPSAAHGTSASETSASNSYPSETGGDSARPAHAAAPSSSPIARVIPAAAAAPDAGPRGERTPGMPRLVAAGARRGAAARPTARPSAPSADSDAPLFDDAVQPELPFSFESFVVGPCNALAREATLALARARQRSLNQLYLGGESGMGKTHLARAAALEARRHAGGLDADPATARAAAWAAATSTRRTPGVVYTTAEQFTSEFVSAMRNGRSEDWQRRYRGRIGLLIVEDVQHLRGREKTQLELFHTVQHVLDAGGRVLLTGDRAPRDLTGLDERVRSQVARGFVAELEPPDALVRRHILRTKASAGGVHLPGDCLDLLVEATTGSVRDIEGVLIQVVTTASLLGRGIDLDLTRRAIDLKSGAATVLPPRRLEVEEIVRLVAGFFGKRPEALASRSRRRDVLVPRQLAMYLAHRYTDASLTEIGRGLGRDHPAVRNAITRIERLCLENAPMRYQVEALSERIDQRLADEREGR